MILNWLAKAYQLEPNFSQICQKIFENNILTQKNDPRGGDKH